MKRILLGLLLAPLPAQAQTIPEGSRVALVIGAAQAECKAADPDAPGTLDIQPAAITWTDLDGDAERDDAIVDFNQIYCASGNLWGGTGGAPIHALIDAAPSDATSGKPVLVLTGLDWQVIRFGDRPLLLMARHGTYCDATGSDPCVLAITFSDAGPLIARAGEN